MALNPNPPKQPFAPDRAGVLKAPGPADCILMPGPEYDDLQCIGPPTAKPKFIEPPPAVRPPKPSSR